MTVKIRTVKIALGFIGTNYEGWQSQKKNKTIQEIFEKFLSRILKQKIVVYGCSRTDSGVHAKEFVAHIRTANPLSDDKIAAALNFYLPRDIVVYSAKTVSSNFHAQFSAKFKVYRYSLWSSRTRPLFEAAFCHWIPAQLDAGRMNRAAQTLVGRHDFTAFMDSQAKEEIRHAVREVYEISVKRKNERIDITIRGSGFLKYMVRIIAGTLVEVGRGRISPEEIGKILALKDRKKAGPTLPAQGLTLLKVRY